MEIIILLQELLGDEKRTEVIKGQVKEFIISTIITIIIIFTDITYESTLETLSQYK